MNIRSVTFDQLTSDEIAAWSAIQRAEPRLASPLFRPEFIGAVAAVRDDVEVAVLEQDGQATGFFPYQRSRWNTGGPVGGRLSDWQGLIAPATFVCDPRDVLRACQLKAWSFDHLPSDQQWFAPYVWHLADSPYVDLSEGYEAYLAQRKNRHGFKTVYKTKTRLLARDVGPLRYEENVADRKIIATLTEWKTAQYHRTRVPNIFRFNWVHDLFDKVLDCHTPDFSCHVSVIYAGDTIAAIHFGMRSGAVLQHWFPAYNVELSRYSPGFLHSLELFKSAAADGIRHIDFGKGNEDYKQRIMSAAAKVAEGRVDLRRGAAIVQRVWCRTRERIRTSPLAAPMRVPVRMARLVQHWAGGYDHQHGKAGMKQALMTTTAVTVRQAAKTAAKIVVLTAGSGLNRFVGSIDPRQVGILMYHRIVDPIAGVPAPTWNVSPSTFRAQLSGLLNRGFVPYSLRSLIEDRSRLRALPKKYFVVTFDDGHESVYRHAWPILKELQIPATVFLPTAYLDSQRPFPFEDWPAAGSSRAPIETWRPMTTAQCLAIAEDGLVELGAHTHTHQDFTDRPEDFESDLALNIEFLRSRLNVHNPPFAFPFGFVTAAMLVAVRRAGLTCGLTSNVSPVDPSESPFGWGRFHVEPWDSANTLAAKLNGWYSWLPSLRDCLAITLSAMPTGWEPAI